MNQKQTYSTEDKLQNAWIVKLYDLHSHPVYTVNDVRLQDMTCMDAYSVRGCGLELHKHAEGWRNNIVLIPIYV